MRGSLPLFKSVYLLAFALCVSAQGSQISSQPRASHAFADNSARHNGDAEATASSFWKHARTLTSTLLSNSAASRRPVQLPEPLFDRVNAALHHQDRILNADSENVSDDDQPSQHRLPLQVTHVTLADLLQYDSGSAEESSAAGEASSSLERSQHPASAPSLPPKTAQGLERMYHWFTAGKRCYVTSFLPCDRHHRVHASGFNQRRAAPEMQRSVHNILVQIPASAVADLQHIIAPDERSSTSNEMQNDDSSQNAKRPAHRTKMHSLGCMKERNGQNDRLSDSGAPSISVSSALSSKTLDDGPSTNDHHLDEGAPWNDHSSTMLHATSVTPASARLPARLLNKISSEAERSHPSAHTLPDCSTASLSEGIHAILSELKSELTSSRFTGKASLHSDAMADVKKPISAGPLTNDQPRTSTSASIWQQPMLASLRSLLQSKLSPLSVPTIDVADSLVLCCSTDDRVQALGVPSESQQSAATHSLSVFQQIEALLKENLREMAFDGPEVDEMDGLLAREHALSARRLLDDSKGQIQLLQSDDRDNNVAQPASAGKQVIQLEEAQSPSKPEKSGRMLSWVVAATSGGLFVVVILVPSLMLAVCWYERRAYEQGKTWAVQRHKSKSSLAHRWDRFTCFFLPHAHSQISKHHSNPKDHATLSLTHPAKPSLSPTSPLIAKSQQTAFCASATKSGTCLAEAPAMGVAHAVVSVKESFEFMRLEDLGRIDSGKARSLLRAHHGHNRTKSDLSELSYTPKVAAQMDAWAQEADGTQNTTAGISCMPRSPMRSANNFWLDDQSSLSDDQSSRSQSPAPAYYKARLLKVDTDQGLDTSTLNEPSPTPLTPTQLTRLQARIARSPSQSPTPSTPRSPMATAFACLSPSIVDTNDSASIEQALKSIKSKKHVSITPVPRDHAPMVALSGSTSLHASASLPAPLTTTETTAEEFTTVPLSPSIPSKPTHAYPKAFHTPLSKASPGSTTPGSSKPGSTSRGSTTAPGVTSGGPSRGNTSANKPQTSKPSLSPGTSPGLGNTRLHSNLASRLAPSMPPHQPQDLSTHLNTDPLTNLNTSPFMTPERPSPQPQKTPKKSPWEHYHATLSNTFKDAFQPSKPTHSTSIGESTRGESSGSMAGKLNLRLAFTGASNTSFTGNSDFSFPSSSHSFSTIDSDASYSAAITGGTVDSTTGGTTIDSGSLFNDTDSISALSTMTSFTSSNVSYAQLSRQSPPYQNHGGPDGHRSLSKNEEKHVKRHYKPEENYKKARSEGASNTQDAPKGLRLGALQLKSLLLTGKGYSEEPTNTTADSINGNGRPVAGSARPPLGANRNSTGDHSVRCEERGHDVQVQRKKIPSKRSQNARGRAAGGLEEESVGMYAASGVVPGNGSGAHHASRLPARGDKHPSGAVGSGSVNAPAGRDDSFSCADSVCSWASVDLTGATSPGAVRIAPVGSVYSPGLASGGFVKEEDFRTSWRNVVDSKGVIPQLREGASR